MEGLFRPAHLVLDDGTRLPCTSFAAHRSVPGEIVFSTSMTGFPEALTDLSFTGQILVLTFPLIGNYGVPDEKEVDAHGIPKYFESDHISISALVISEYNDDKFSHWNAKQSLGEWLRSQNIPAICGLDTRELTKKIRSKGSLLAKIVIDGDDESLVPFEDPNKRNLVAAVSTREPKYFGSGDYSIIVVDCGIKLNMIRQFVDKGLRIKVVPWDYDILSETESYDGVFISNGPGDPMVCWKTVMQVRGLLAREEKDIKPIFGVCLGNQILALASGAKTYKMKFGNRSVNQPCIDSFTKKCYITPQNHGFAVDTKTLPEGWVPFFTNANDQTNEGIIHTSKPYFSVQFHPEARGGPTDTEYLFDLFLDKIKERKTTGRSTPINDTAYLWKSTNPVTQHRAIKALEPSLSTRSPLLSAITRSPAGSPSHVAPAPEMEPLDLGEKTALSEKMKTVVPEPLKGIIKKVLVVGSGGLSIGQAGEFDYSGSQAIKALKEEGIKTVLINPNIATNQTSKGLADKVYFLPLTRTFVEQVIEKERPDGILCTFGGQTALSVGMDLSESGILAKYNIRVLGTPIDTIIATEDREIFANKLAEIGVKIAPSVSANTVEEAVEAARQVGYPVIMRLAYALGGLGSDFAEDEEKLRALATHAFSHTSQVLVEKSLKGWKEIEYEVVRDCKDNCITVAAMENFDPLGIHTGDSIVISPCQTLSNEEFFMLRELSIRTVRHLGVVGECNIQFALDPHSLDYCVIEVNARLSRSSALASKATGYPLAFVAAKLALNFDLSQIKNSVTKVTCACFEPALDYVVVKVPRFDLGKFDRVAKKIGSSMKSVGEVMAIGRSFEEAFQKAMRMVSSGLDGFEENPEYVSEIDADGDATARLDEELRNPSEERIFALATAFRRGYTVDRLHELSRIDRWFLNKLERIMKLESRLRTSVPNLDALSLDRGFLLTLKQAGFADKQIAKVLECSEMEVRQLRHRPEMRVLPVVKQIDTLAGEYPAMTNYLYMTYNGTEDDVCFKDNGVMVLGSGAYRIGSSVEFDWCAVGAVRTLRSELGYRAIMVNFNPETVSTDFDECDRLYFEEISLERVLDIYERENSAGVIISVGGQTPNNLALPLERNGVKILGTSPNQIDRAEDRFKFSQLLDSIHVDQPAWKELRDMSEATAFSESVGFPVLVRPSYVLSGAAMAVAYSTEDLIKFLEKASKVSKEHPVVVSKFITEAKEVDFDAVAQDGEIVVYAISEHVENAGVHSGDATLVLPAQNLYVETMRRVKAISKKIAKSLNITGPFNIQYIAKDNDVKVIECNLRASRTFPFVSKVFNIDFIEVATKVMIGIPVPKFTQNFFDLDYCGVKAPQFSFTRLHGADPILGVEMASTGEVATFGEDKHEAFLKALLASNFKLPKKNIYISVGGLENKVGASFLNSAPLTICSSCSAPIILDLDIDAFERELEMIEASMITGAERLVALGYKLFASPGTSAFLAKNDIEATTLFWPEDSKEPNVEDVMMRREIELVINIPSFSSKDLSDITAGYRVRRLAADLGISLITNMKCARMFVESLERVKTFEVKSWDEYILKDSAI